MGQSMQSTVIDPRLLLGAYLEANTDSAKHLARMIGCEPRTAEGYRAGRYWPQAKHWPRLVAAFGRDLVMAVFLPDEQATELDRTIAKYENALHNLRRARAAIGVKDHRRPARCGHSAIVGPRIVHSSIDY